MARRTRSSISAMPLRRRCDSSDRFSEYSLHADYLADKDSNMCNDCMGRVPYATLIATIMCCLGVGVFCASMFRGATLSTLMLNEVFHLRLNCLEPLQMIFSVIGASMAALGFMILCVGCLATGATRTKVYRAWRTRVGGRISCAVFMTIAYIMHILWLLMFAFLIIITLTFSIFWGFCMNPRVRAFEDCIDLKPYQFLFPDYVRNEDMEICGSQEVKLFCKDYVEKAEVMFILATVASILVILSLLHFLMCLSANYAHIRDHEKFQELQELQYLQEPGVPDSPQSGGRMDTLGKGRF
ncbi:neuronal membrane glycoprotein M6-b isoform X1 [Copidosoma floridanum]|uniref:neuronal membrane glycoprotein M6-b isoform X1 n=1 Tax=Copidosoma floridanum TaxID=29053 RepID=UPI0006C9DE73|nr:neuronal membrane glycoprotein M6-b isoform X1 [Copidosoma floridanum]